MQLCNMQLCNHVCAVSHSFTRHKQECWGVWWPQTPAGPAGWQVVLPTVYFSLPGHGVSDCMISSMLLGAVNTAKCVGLCLSQTEVWCLQGPGILTY